MKEKINSKDETRISFPMTDKEIGKTVREIAEEGFNAIVKKSKDGIVILREKCEIVKSDKER